MTTHPVVIVGIGADGWDGLSESAKGAILGAEVLMGSPRQLDLVPATHLGARRAPTRLTWPSPMIPALPSMFAENADRRVCVLASGDPMFHGLGVTLVRLLGADNVRVNLPPVVGGVGERANGMGIGRDRRREPGQPRLGDSIGFRD